LIGPIRLTSADYRRVPWKNGLGSTLELVRIPLPGDDDRFLARVSIADVAQDGPFSVFAGYDRWIAVIEGTGMALTVDEADAVERRWMQPPLAFSGDAATACRLLDGPIRDANLMIDRANARGEMTLLSDRQPQCAMTGDWLLAHCLTGELRVRDGGGRTFSVRAGDSIVLPQGTTTVGTVGGSQGLCAALRLRR